MSPRTHGKSCCFRWREGHTQKPRDGKEQAAVTGMGGAGRSTAVGQPAGAEEVCILFS